MPIMEIHLAEGAYEDEQLERLSVECSRWYAKVLQSPIERIRVFIHEHRACAMAVDGVPVSRGARPAPYFQFIVLQGRPVEQRHALLTGFTDLIVDILGVNRGLVRGGCWPIPPEDWAIGGTPASIKRAEEVAAREQTAKSPVKLDD